MYNEKSGHKNIIETAKKRFKLAESAEQEMRIEALDDQRFRIGDQWDERDKALRAEYNRPCLTVNRIPQFIRQVTNDQKQNTPSIRISPVDDSADVDTADILQGMIRHVEYNSNADVAYDNAFDSAVGHGFGWFRIITDYVSPFTFKQEPKIKQIKDSMKVFCDPYFQEPDGSDMNWCFIVEDFSKEDYKAEYKDSDLSKMNDWDSLGIRTPDWIDEDSCRVVEYYYKEYENKTLCLVEVYDDSTGEIREESILKDELPDEFPKDKILAERETKICTVKWCKLNGVEVLEETTWPSQYIPVIPVLGEDLIVEGKRHRSGIVRNAKDPQKMLNYWVTCETETIALSPKSPFIGAEGQFEGHEEEWATANTRPHSKLEYKPITINGNLAPAPQRNVFEAPVQAITNARVQASEDLKATTGIYDASLGNRSNENSGIAIQRRNQQSQTSNYHFVDNLSLSIRHCGRILLEIIPTVYSAADSVRILGENNEQKIVRINEYFEENGEQKIYDLSSGKYDVTVDDGPNYQTKRQEAAESMLAFIKAYPNAAPLIGDLMARNMDWPGSQEIAERLKKTLPPEMQEMDEDGKQKIPPQVEAQIQQMSQLIEQLTGELNAKSEEIKTKQVENESKERLKQMEIESKERVEFAKLENDILLEKLKQSSQYAQWEIDRQQAELQRYQDESRQTENEIENENFNNGVAPSSAAIAPQITEQPAAEVTGAQFMEE